MRTPAEADAAIAAVLGQAPAECAPLAECAGRVLREAVCAERDVPPFDRVTMDGIAIAGTHPDPLRREYRVAGVAPAGAVRATLASPAHCIEVTTGAVLPEGCDTVVPIERVRVSGGRAVLEADYEPQPWRFVHRRGTDARSGDRLLAPGMRLGPPELAIAASAGRAALAVSRRPGISVVTTGDELVEPGPPILDHQLRRSNAYGLAAALALAGFAPLDDRHLPDQEQALASSLADALERHDVLVLSGGVSAGRFDFVPGVLTDLGVRNVFHRVAQRPGRPLWFGIGARGQAVFALPGNPVSVLVCLARYVVPALRRVTGEAAPPAPRAVLAREFACDAPLACFLPVHVRYDAEARAVAEPRPTGGSGDVVSLAGTDGFVELPMGPGRFPAGLAVPFYRW